MTLYGGGEPVRPMAAGEPVTAEVVPAGLKDRGLRNFPAFPRITGHAHHPWRSSRSARALSSDRRRDRPASGRAAAAGKIEMDGKLDDAAWQQAAVLDTFYETYPGDNTEPAAKTVVYLTYDDHDFYIGIHAFDPEPAKIRAPFVERDNVVGTDDNIAVFLDTRNDRRSAVELRVNPRGNQADAIYNDANGNEDFSPDFFYDTAAQITDDGWTAEMRIPLSSLRYPKLAENRWGILVWRNYPRDQRYAFHSSPIPRGSNCWICQSRELTGLTGLPGGGHLVAAPYVTGQQPRRAPGRARLVARGPGPRGRRRPRRQVDSRARSNALDLTINPDFSQVESDVGQIAVNNQFAHLLPREAPVLPGGRGPLRHADPGGLHPHHHRPQAGASATPASWAPPPSPSCSPRTRGAAASSSRARPATTSRRRTSPPTCWSAACGGTSAPPTSACWSPPARTTAAATTGSPAPTSSGGGARPTR